MELNIPLTPTQQLPILMIDFEARSTINIKDSGAVRYAEDPTTEIMMMAYRFMGPGEQTELWEPGQPFPQRIIDHVEKGYPVAAHAVLMEFSTWFHHLHKKLGIPMPSKWIDTMASCAYRALPLGLDDVGKVLDLGIQKDRRGKYLINRLCKPRKLRKAERKVFEDLGMSPEDFPIVYEEDEELMQEFRAYCVKDVDSEIDLLETIWHIPKSEYRLWVIDQRINWRGVKIDREAVEAAIDIIEQITEKETKRLQEITMEKGEPRLKTAGQVAEIVQWCNEQGWEISDLRADTVKDNIEIIGDGPAFQHVKEVLSIRQTLSKASTKKYYRFLVTVCEDDRVRGMLQYHGAGTGRWAGRLVQPQNFPRGSLEKYAEELGLIKKDDGMAMTMDILVEVIKLRCLETLEVAFGDAMEALATALRGMFIAEEEKEFFVADFSAIEAVVTAWLAGEDWKVEAFRKINNKEGYKGSPDIYCATASGIFGYPVVDKKAQAKERGIGKVCLAGDTPILTNLGWTRLDELEYFHKLWDGKEWVEHDGLIYNGEKETIDLCGVKVTPDHKIEVGEEWIDAQKVVSNLSILKSALATGSESLLSWDNKRGHSSGAVVHAGMLPTKFTSAIFGLVGQLDAIRAQRKLPLNGEKTTGNIPMFVPMTIPEGDSLIGSQVQLEDVIILTTGDGKTTAGVGSTYGTGGAKIKGNSFNISAHLAAMTDLTSRWIASTLTKVMSLGTYDSVREEKIQEINERLQTYKNESKSLKRVYDIANAGPRNKFTIMTLEGPLVVSNCELAFGYQGALGAWRAFDSSDKYTDEEVKQFCYSWRDSHPAIVALWYGLEKAAKYAVRNPGTRYHYRSVSYEMVKDKAGNWLCCILPNGRRLWYYEPWIEEYFDVSWGRDREDLRYMGRDNKKGGSWGVVSTYGGMLTENVVQAISRDIMAEAMFRLEREGFPIILTVHDEIVAEVPKGSDFKLFKKLMKENLPWLEGCPIGTDSWHWNRYRK